jgi:hypothetical protein
MQIPFAIGLTCEALDWDSSRQTLEKYVRCGKPAKMRILRGLVVCKVALCQEHAYQSGAEERER